MNWKRLKRYSLLIVIALLVPLLLLRPASAAIAFRAASSGNNGGGLSTLSLTTPSGTAENDLMIAVVSVRGGTGVTITPPAGWTQINSNDSGTTLKSAIFYKFAASGEFTFYDFTFSASNKASGVVSSYSGVDLSNPINDNGSQANASNATMTAPSITTTVTNTWIVAAFGTATGTTVTPGSSMTERGEDASTSNGAASRTTSQLQDVTQSATGATGTKTATAGAAAVNIGHTIALTPAPVVSQVGYKFFANSTTSGSVGTELAAQDTLATAPSVGQPFRLRMLLGVADAQLATSIAFKLQYKVIPSGTCTATGAFTEVGTTTPIRWYDNSSPADGYTPLNSSGSDPVRSGVSVTNQSYEEANNFTVATAIPAGNDGMWDFALTFGNNVDSQSIYCLRAIYSSGVGLTTYSAIPSVQPLQDPGTLTGQDYRWYTNADSTTPGTSLAAVDAAATFSSAGGNARLRMGVNGLGHFKKIATGMSHTCAIGSDNNAYCWGNDTYGQLGNGATTGTQDRPVAVDTSGVLNGKTILDIYVGDYHSCAIASDNLAYCWGDDGNGQVGNGGTTGNQSSPVAVDTSGVLSGKTVLSMSLKNVSSCAIASDNLAYCWGNDGTGQLGNGAPTTNQTSPGAVDTSGVLSGKTIKSISMGDMHGCVIASDNNLYCWGSDTYEQLGNGATSGTQDSPVAVDTSGALSGKTVISVTSGQTHTCAIASDNLAYCWGDDSNGQLGNGATSGTQDSPVAVDTSGLLSGKTIIRISADSYVTCAIASDNNGYCWGSDASGQLGNGATSGLQASPVAITTAGVLSGKTLFMLVAGDSYTCAITTDRFTSCWGDDASAQLGNGATTGNQVSPVSVNVSGVLVGKTISKVTAGYYHTCAIASDNLAYCWGGDSNGQLGNGPGTVNQTTPTAVDMSGVLSGKTVSTLSAGGIATCAIASDNNAYCWGGDASGQLGNGAATTTDQVSPVAVDTSGVLSGKTILKISAGLNHVCAIASDNLAYCWGNDNNGQLGNGATTGNQASPVAVDTSGVLSGKTVLNIAAGNSHTCVIASDNNVYCWGADASGQLGNGATSGDQASPVAVDTSGVLSGKTVLSISLGQAHSCIKASDNNAYCWGSDASGQLGDGSPVSNQVSPVAVDTSGYLSGLTISKIMTGGNTSCAIASDNKAYCWGSDSAGQVGNGSVVGSPLNPYIVDTDGAFSDKTPQDITVGNAHTCAIVTGGKLWCWGSDSDGQQGNGPSTTNQISPVEIKNPSVITPAAILANKLNLVLQFAQKSAGSCSAQTGFANITGSTAIAFNDNATPANAASIASEASDPLAAAIVAAQTYHDATGSIVNTSAITADKFGLWDFSLKDNSAPAGTTYCLRLANADGTAFGSYEYYPEITTYSSITGPTLEQSTRGGSGVINGVKQNFSW